MPKATKPLKQKGTEARQAFEVNVQRASFFLDIHEQGQQGAGAPTLAYRELPRSAVVFAVGALDAYLSEVSAEVMVRDFEKMVASSDTRETLRRIQSDLPTLALEISVLPDHTQRLQRIRDVIVDHFQNKVSMHGAKAVAGTAGRIGAKAADVWSALGSRGFTDSQGKLDMWTETRHQIVHQGKKPTVWRPKARECIKLISAIVDVVDGFALSVSSPASNPASS